MEILKNVKSYEAILCQDVSIHSVGADSVPSVDIPIVRNPLKIIDCVPHWTGMHFEFTLYWTVPEFVAYGSGIFKSFVVIAEERVTKRYIDRKEVQKTPNQTLYSYTWQNLRPLQDNRKYQFRVSMRCSLCICKCSISSLSV